MPFLDYRDPEREKILDKIRRAEAEISTAGPMHARDLRKHIKRLRKELTTYGRRRAEERRRPALN